MIASALLATAGCYSYAEVSPTAVPPGSSVRIRLDGEVKLRAGDLPLPGDGRSLRGNLLEGTSADTVLCSVALNAGDSRAVSRGLRATVAVPFANVRSLELRKLDRVRTGVTVGGFLVLSAIILDQAFDIRNAREGSDDKDGVDNAHRVIFRLRW